MIIYIVTFDLSFFVEPKTVSPKHRAILVDMTKPCSSSFRVDSKGHLIIGNTASSDRVKIFVSCPLDVHFKEGDGVCLDKDGCARRCTLDDNKNNRIIGEYLDKTEQDVEIYKAECGHFHVREINRDKTVTFYVEENCPCLMSKNLYI